MWVVPTLLALRVYLPKANELLLSLNQQDRSLLSLCCFGSPFTFRVNGKLFIFFDILRFQPRFAAMEK